jgi:ribonuclease HI
MVKCYFDGACEPRNPGGNMGMGAYILVDNKKVFEYSNHLSASRLNSNNVAEYMALEEILKYLKQNTFKENLISIYGDSNLVIQQMSGKWRIKHGLYKESAIRCKSLVTELSGKYQLNFKWIPREINQEADRLSKRSLKDNNVEFKIQEA